MTATSDNPEVTISISQPEGNEKEGTVKFDYRGAVKTHKVRFN